MAVRHQERYLMKPFAVLEDTKIRVKSICIKFCPGCGGKKEEVCRNTESSGTASFRDRSCQKGGALCLLKLLKVH